MSSRVLMLGTFDSKGEEYAFLRKRIEACGCEVVSINTGVEGSTDLFPVDVEADDQFQRRLVGGRARPIGAGDFLRILSRQQ